MQGRIALPGLLMLVLISGCASGSHMSASGLSKRPVVLVSHGTERGQDRPIIDGVGWVWGIPKKIIYWNRRVENHQISDETVTAVEDYLEDRGLTDVKVRVNQYAPIDEWHRLQQNTEVAAGWRYTFGTFRWIGYTVFPGRVFGGDSYNPYTDTISIYSDVPSIGIAEAAYSNDVHHQQLPGTYATFQQIQGINMWHVTKSTTDALAYIQEHGEPAAQREAYNVLYPRYGYAAGLAVGSYVSIPGLQLAGAISGHAVGRHRSRQILDQQYEYAAVNANESLNLTDGPRDSEAIAR